MKVAAVIQTSSRDWEGNLDLSLKRIEGEPAISRVIERVKKIESIDDIIIAAPATEENAIFRKIAEKKDVKCFLGSESNVTERLLDAAQLTKADVIVRVLGQHFLLDHSLIQEMIGYLTSGNFDLVQPPEAFSIKYAAEIVRTEALKRARDEISNLVDAKDVAVFQSRPIAYFKCHPDRFRIGIYEKVPFHDPRAEKQRGSPPEGVLRDVVVFSAEEAPEFYMLWLGGSRVFRAKVGKPGVPSEWTEFTVSRRGDGEIWLELENGGKPPPRDLVVTISGVSPRLVFMAPCKKLTLRYGNPVIETRRLPENIILSLLSKGEPVLGTQLGKEGKNAGK